jgi:hypothetical protein
VEILLLFRFSDVHHRFIQGMKRSFACYDTTGRFDVGLQHLLDVIRGEPIVGIKIGDRIEAPRLSQ